MTGPLRFAATALPSTYNGQDVYLFYGTDGKVRMQLPSSRSGFAIDNATGVMSFSYLPTCTTPPSSDSQLTNKSYVDSKLVAVRDELEALKAEVSALRAAS